MKRKAIEVKSFYGATYKYIRLAIYAALAVAFIAVVSIRPELKPWWGILAVLVIVTFELYFINKKQRDFVGYIQHLDFCLNDNSRGTLFNYPAPLVITDLTGKITWYNENFGKAVNAGDGELFGKILGELIPEIKVSKFAESDEQSNINLHIGENFYEVWGNVAHNHRSGKHGDLVVFYFIDKTKEVEAIGLREDERMIECIVIIDNYDEVLKETADSNHGALLGEIEQKINNWVALGNGILRKYERDKFIVFFSNKNFQVIMDNKFSVS